MNNNAHMKIHPIMVPFSSKLKSVNFFLVKQSGSLSIIDAGLDNDRCWNHLQMTLKKHGYQLKDITEILLTHHHTDHIGLINQILAEHPVPVYVHPYAIPKLLGDLGFIQMSYEFFNSLYAKMDVPDIGAQQAHRQYHHAVKEKDKNKHWDIRKITDVQLEDFEVMHIPGHAPEQVAFYNKKGKQLIAGDLVT